MGETVQLLLQNSIAKSTRRSYESAQKRFSSFCTSHNLPSFPVTQHTLCLYVAFLYEQDLAQSTIKCYLSSVRHLQISKGFPDPFSSPFPQLQLLLRGIKVCRGLQGRNCPTRKLPITPFILRQFKKLWLPHQHDYHYVMLWAVCCCCFFGFFRSGELTVPSFASYDVASHLGPQDISVDNATNPSLVQFNLKSSKTDPFRKGVQVVVGRTGNDLCPVVAILAYLSFRGTKPGALFCNHDSSPYTRGKFVKDIKSGLQQLGYNSSQYAGHSFRAGAATAATTAGLQDSLIKTLGRWESSAYQLYVRLPKKTLGSLSKSLS